MENNGATSNVQNVQEQVNTVINVMKNNMEKVLEREQGLNNIDQRAENLQAGASQFQQTARSVGKKYWWQNMRMMIIMGAIGIVLLIIIILWIVN